MILKDKVCNSEIPFTCSWLMSNSHSVNTTDRAPPLQKTEEGACYWGEGRWNIAKEQNTSSVKGELTLTPVIIIMYPCSPGFVALTWNISIWNEIISELKLEGNLLNSSYTRNVFDQMFSSVYFQSRADWVHSICGKRSPVQHKDKWEDKKQTP